MTAKKTTEVLRLVISYDTKKAMDIGRQTLHIKTSELKKKTPVVLRGKKVKSISVEIVNMDNDLPEET